MIGAGPFLGCLDLVDAHHTRIRDRWLVGATQYNHIKAILHTADRQLTGLQRATRHLIADPKTTAAHIQLESSEWARSPA
jgi:hypothetical protein